MIPETDWPKYKCFNLFSAILYLKDLLKKYRTTSFSATSYYLAIESTKRDVALYERS